MFSVQTARFMAILLAFPAAALASDEGDYLRLVAALDEPEYYCIDLAGMPGRIQLDDPLQTHTCKRRRAEDQMFRFADGRLEITEYDRCVQVAGSSGTTLAGSAVLARACSNSAMQQFSLDDNGRIRVAMSDFCLVAGIDSAEASGPSHMWRTLTVGSCSRTSGQLLSWQIGLADIANEGIQQ